MLNPRPTNTSVKYAVAGIDKYCLWGKLVDIVGEFVNCMLSEGRSVSVLDCVMPKRVWTCLPHY